MKMIAYRFWSQLHGMYKLCVHNPISLKVQVSWREVQENKEERDRVGGRDKLHFYPAITGN